MIEAFIALFTFVVIAGALWATEHWAEHQAHADAAEMLDWWKDTHA